MRLRAEAPELLLLMAYTGRQGLDGGAEVGDLRGEARQAVRVSASHSVFLDDGTKALVAIERGAAHSCLNGNSSEAERSTVCQQLGAGALDAGERLGRGHPVFPSASNMSRRATRRR